MKALELQLTFPQSQALSLGRRICSVQADLALKGSRQHSSWLLMAHLYVSPLWLSPGLQLLPCHSHGHWPLLSWRNGDRGPTQVLAPVLSPWVLFEIEKQVATERTSGKR